MPGPLRQSQCSTTSATKTTTALRTPNKSAPNSPSSPPPATTTYRKLSLPAPITLSEFAMALILYLCRSYVLCRLEIKLLVYALIVVFGSFAHEFVRLPDIYLSHKNNVLNVYFVKFSWAWTLILLSPFIYSTAKVYSAGDNRNVAKQMSRLVVSTAVWFFFCSHLFIRVGQTYGVCSRTVHTNRYDACVSSGGEWNPFDISGHVFLLLYICMLHSEEGAVFRRWARIKQLVERCERDGAPPPGLANLRDVEIEQLDRDYEFYTPMIQWNFILITIANLIWDICFVITVFYHHSFIQKFIACVLASTCWYLTYRVWYRARLSPGMPGMGRVQYMNN